jgi:hypothetical protein
MENDTQEIEQVKMPEGLTFFNNQEVETPVIEEPVGTIKEPVISETPKEQLTITREQAALWGLTDDFVGKPVEEIGWQYRNLRTDYTQKAQKLSELEKNTGLPKQQPVEELRPPARPQKPKGYRELLAEASSDPYSDAAREVERYEEEVEIYHEKVLDWNNKQWEKKIEPIQTHFKTVQEQEQEKQKKQLIAGEIARDIGDVNKAVKITEWTGTPEFYSGKNLAGYYDYVEGIKNKTNPLLERKAQEYERRNGTESVLPPGVGVVEEKEKSFADQQKELRKILRM